MARGNGKIDGWGQYLQPSMTIPVINKAIGGRSVRSYTVEGRFNEVGRSVQAGDFVVIEFGHNDGGSLAKDNGRTDCPGSGNQTCQSTHGGRKVTVLTFPAYLINAGKLMAAKGAKGAKVVYSSMTPNNIWEGNGS
jgi:rhamnogalacturonan acetylesterase